MVMPAKVYRYYLPVTHDREYDSWSLWLLDARTRSVSIISDYGNWAHCWGGLFSGGQFEDDPNAKDWRREFISFGGGDGDYIRRKLCYGVARLFDAEGTVKAMGDYIQRAVQDEDMTEEEALDMRAELKFVDSELTWSTFLDEHSEHELWELSRYRTHEHQWVEHLTTISFERLKKAIEAQLFREKSYERFKNGSRSNT